MINLQYNILLVDTSYAIYHKFYSVQKWYKLSQNITDEDAKNIDWLKNDIFMKKYNDLFMTNILRACKKYNIPSENIIFTIDSKFGTNWRYNEKNEYKATRLDNHKKNGFTSFDIFRYTIKNTLINYSKKYNFTCLSVPCCEADDIIAGCVKYIEDKLTQNTTNSTPSTTNTRPNIYIYSADGDYIQICGPNIKLINHTNLIISDKYITVSNEYSLFQKILIGDINDNIKNISIYPPDKTLPPNTQKKTSIY